MTAPGAECVDFDGLDISFDATVLRPRSWTVAQSHWAAQLLDELPDGPVLELCCGAGQIGLAAVAHNRRSLVCVDLNPAAVDFTEKNAAAAGMGDRVTVRLGRLTEVVAADERFPLVIADPPWVESDRTGAFPEDPLEAIDGGGDGLAVARQCLTVLENVLDDRGAGLLQLGTVDQVRDLLSRGSGRLRCREVRRFDRGAVVLLTRVDQDVPSRGSTRAP